MSIFIVKHIEKDKKLNSFARFKRTSVEDVTSFLIKTNKKTCGEKFFLSYKDFNERCKNIINNEPQSKFILILENPTELAHHIYNYYDYLYKDNENNLLLHELYQNIIKDLEDLLININKKDYRDNLLIIIREKFCSDTEKEITRIKMFLNIYNDKKRKNYKKDIDQQIFEYANIDYSTLAYIKSLDFLIKNTKKIQKKIERILKEDIEEWNYIDSYYKNKQKREMRKEAIDYENNKFFLFGFPRSGTTLLVSLLNNQKDVLCYSEIFNETKIIYNESHYEENIYLRNKRPIDFLKNVEAKQVAKNVGFKILFNQEEDVLSYLFSKHQNKRKVIYIYRKNLLKAFVSSLIAVKTGQWHIYHKTEDTRDNPKITIDCDKMINFIHNKVDQIVFFEEMLKINKMSYYKVAYEDIKKDLPNICSFLDIDFLSTEEKIYKVLSDDISKHILNFEEVKDRLSGTEHEWMVN